MIQNSSIFSQESEEIRPAKKLMISKCYENIKISKKALKDTGIEVEVIKDFHIEITSNGTTQILEYARGEVLSVVKGLFNKYVHLGMSPSGFYIISEIDEEYFRKLNS